MKQVGHKYILNLYARVNEYLANGESDQESLANIIVYFCTVVEKILKIKLHEKNPVLAFDFSKLKDRKVLIDVVNGKEGNTETVKMLEVTERFKLIYPGVFSDEEIQAILSVCSARNGLIHDYKDENIILSDKESVIKKMGTIWEKLSGQAIILFGKDKIKQSTPKKIYTEEELESVLIEEVRKKLQLEDRSLPIYSYAINTLGINSSPFMMSGEQCPRCGSYGFSLENSQTNMDFAVATISSVFGARTNLYKCSNCHLELTNKEYEIAKKIKGL